MRDQSVRVSIRRVVSAPLLVGLCLAVRPAEARGQYLPERRVTAGLVGAVVAPTGDLDEIARGGVGVTALFQVTRSFWGVRGELGYTALGGDRVLAAGGEVDAPDTRILSAAVNAVVGAGTLREVVRPYFIAGIGVYRFDYGDVDPTVLGDYSARTDVGLNAGVAVRFPLGPFTAVVESRLHNVFSDAPTRYVTPIGFGITF